MESSERIESIHATSSPCGKFIASITNNHLRVHDAQEPRRYQDLRLRNPSTKDIIAVKWHRDSRFLAVLSTSRIEILDLETATPQIRIDNGTGSLGRFSAAEFVGRRHFLTVWEFGRAKLWNLTSGRGVEVGDLKGLGSGGAAYGRSWRERPGVATQDDGGGGVEALAMLLRPAADDFLQVQLLGGPEQVLPAVKLPTVDAHAVSWSPDGRWIVVLDSPRANTSLYVYTPDGHLFRSYPASPPPLDSGGLSVKTLTWSPDSQILALAGFDGRITLLNTRTVAPIAVIEHATTIDQTPLLPESQAPVWQECVSGSNERTYARLPQPFSPPLSNRKPPSSSTDVDPADLGVAETTFNCTGTLLASRDERMPSSIWLWDLATLSPLAVIVQHRDVKKMHWHPTKGEMLIWECGEGIAYLLDASNIFAAAPRAESLGLTGIVGLTWLRTPAEAKTRILATTKSAFQVGYPDGRDPVPLQNGKSWNDHFKKGVSSSEEAEKEQDEEDEDSLMDLLSGRKPLPPKTEPSYTEMVDLEVEENGEEDRLDDTFRAKKEKAMKNGERELERAVEVDPLDDSEIF